MKKIVFFLISMLLLTACARLTGANHKRYLQSRNGAIVVVPPPLTASNISHFYDLPPQNQNPLVNIAPPSAPKLKQETG